MLILRKTKKRPAEAGRFFNRLNKSGLHHQTAADKENPSSNHSNQA